MSRAGERVLSIRGFEDTQRGEMRSWITNAPMMATPQASDSRISFLVLMVRPAYRRPPSPSEPATVAQEQVKSTTTDRGWPRASPAGAGAAGTRLSTTRWPALALVSS
jgi:hypothetical protein